MLTDYPKYVGFEGHPESFARPEAEALVFGEYDYAITGDEYAVASAALNHQFSLSNENWNDKEHDHMSELYVRVRDVEPLVKAVRESIAVSQALVDAISDVESDNAAARHDAARIAIAEALTKLADIP